jgi:hypothetical protein
MKHILVLFKGGIKMAKEYRTDIGSKIENIPLIDVQANVEDIIRYGCRVVGPSCVYNCRSFVETQKLNTELKEIREEFTKEWQDISG